jgi:hypothetical protein
VEVKQLLQQELVLVATAVMESISLQVQLLLAVPELPEQTQTALVEAGEA